MKLELNKTQIGKSFNKTIKNYLFNRKYHNPFK